MAFSKHVRRRRKSPHERETPTAYLGLGFVALAVVLGLFWIAAPQPEVVIIDGRVTHVRDGDTIEIGPVVIRLAALDCAELGSPAGERAKREMIRLVGGQRVSCSDLGPDRYGRMLGQCQKADDPLTLSEHLVQGGYCGYYGVGAFR